MEDLRFWGDGGLNIHVRAWRPEGPVRGVVAIVPGFNSHVGYYSWVAERLAARGLAVYGVDLRGRGRSEGERFFVERFDEYVLDVDGLVTLARSREPGVPIFLLGHSAGGVVSCIYAIEHPTALAGLICASFAHQVPAPAIVLTAVKGASHVAPHAHVLRLKNEDFSRDPAAVQAMNADPLIKGETQPAQTLAEMVRADERLKKSFPLITLPVLILHGTADRTTKPSGSQFFYDIAGSPDKTLKLYQGHYHDLFNDVGKEQVLGDVVSWIEARLPPPA